jgi:hypothetical protein
MMSRVLTSAVVGLPRGMLAAPLASSILVRDAIARSAVSGPFSYPVESTTLRHVRTMPADAGMPPPAAAGPIPEPHPAVMQDPASDSTSAIAYLMVMTAPCLALFGWC